MPQSEAHLHLGLGLTCSCCCSAPGAVSYPGCSLGAGSVGGGGQPGPVYSGSLALQGPGLGQVGQPPWALGDTTLLPALPRLPTALLGILYEDKERQDFIFTIYHWWQAVAIFTVYLGSSLPMKVRPGRVEESFWGIRHPPHHAPGHRYFLSARLTAPEGHHTPKAGPWAKPTGWPQTQHSVPHSRRPRFTYLKRFTACSFLWHIPAALWVTW